MEFIRPDQILTLLLFMAVLGLAWVAVKMNRGGLAHRIAGDRRLRLVEVAALSATDRALILSVDGCDYLILRCKGEAPLMHPLPPAPRTEDAA